MPKSIEAKIEFVKDDAKEEKFHVYKREKGFLSFFMGWTPSQRLKTLQEAEEKIKSLGSSVEYLGIFENGVRKGTMAWDDNKANKPAPKPLDLPDTEEIQWDNRMRRK